MVDALLSSSLTVKIHTLKTDTYRFYYSFLYLFFCFLLISPCFGSYKWTNTLFAGSFEQTHYSSILIFFRFSAKWINCTAALVLSHQLCILIWKTWWCERERWNRQNSAMYDEEQQKCVQKKKLLFFFLRLFFLASFFFSSFLSFSPVNYSFLTVFHWAHALSCILYKYNSEHAPSTITKEIIYAFVSITFIDGNLLRACIEHIITAKWFGDALHIVKEKQMNEDHEKFFYFYLFCYFFFFFSLFRIAVNKKGKIQCDRKFPSIFITQIKCIVCVCVSIYEAKNITC